MSTAVARISLAYVAVLLAATLADIVVARTTQHGVRALSGCNLHDALLVGVECRGFFGSGFVEFCLNLPFVMFYVSMLVPSAPALLIPAAILWAPVLYLAWRVWRRLASV